MNIDTPLLQPLHARWSMKWSVCLLLWSILLCQLPLFNLLSFEFAFACCLPISFLGAHCGIRAQDGHLFSQWYSATKRGCLLALLPLLPITLNQFWVRNCNWVDGLSFYIILPLCSLSIAAGYGVLIKTLTRRQEEGQTKTLKSLGYFTGLFMIVALWGGISFIATPSVDVFSTFLGYYPGAIYDEELAIGARLILSRLEDFMLIAFALALAGSSPKKYLFCLLSMSYILGWSFDLHRPNFWVQYRLGGAVTSTHFQLYYPHTWSNDRVELMLKELAFNYEELSHFFGFRPQKKINVYFYRNPRHKKRLMGAGQTLIAKPWQRSIHVHAPYIGDRVITHELAHVFSADIAPAPHHLSMRYGVLPHMSLIEGLAVAATWTRGRGNSLLSRLSPHQWTAAMRRLKLAPSMAKLLQPTSFYGYNSSLAYTMCGSFVRFYRDKEGQEALNELYATGGQVLKLKNVVDEWGEWLDQHQLTDQVLKTAQSLLNYPSIFSKVCAHELATRRSRALHLEAEGQLKEALMLWQSIQDDVPGDQTSLLKTIKILYRQNKHEEALNIANQALANHQNNDKATLSYLVHLRLKEWVIDLNNPTSDMKRPPAPQNPHRGYQDLIDQTLNRPAWRRLSIKRYAYHETTPSELSSFIMTLLLASSSSIETLKDQLSSALNRWPTSAELHYLQARQQFNQERYKEAESQFKIALELGLNHHSLEYESLRLLALSSFYKGEYHEATDRFHRMLERKDLALLGGEIYELKLWKRRAHFFLKH